ncbi:DUF58 domain-containing protein [Angustibacter luteus]|uniref:DUF58 domain-containing protein n=1 Tax=Angustibacter luteus TaxID=658456 RepID=A0ABW1JA53_9ACTN
MTLRASRRKLGRTLLGPLSRLTTRGRAVLAAGLTCALCAVVLGQQDLLRVGVLLALVPVLTVVVLGRSRYRLACSRSVSPVRVEVGKASQVVLEVANVSSTRCGMVLAEEQVPYTLGTRPRFVLPGLEPGERRAVSYPVRSDVRGRFLIGPLSLTLTDPFGMGEHRRSFTARDQLIVIPRVVALPPVQLPGDWSGSGDSRPRAVSASGEDDVTTREYHQGDDLRRVHWRSTARRGELMVRREEQPWQSRATLLLDRRRAAHRGDGSASSFEWAVSAIGSVAVHLAARGYAVRMVDGTEGQESANPWAHISSGGESTSSAVLDTLSAVSAGGEIELRRAVHAAARAATGGLVVAALGEIDAQDTSLLASLHQAGTNCIALVADTTSAINDATLRAEVSARTMAQVEQLRAAGWDVVPVRSQEPLDHTWRRIGAGRTVGGARR